MPVPIPGSSGGVVVQGGTVLVCRKWGDGSDSLSVLGNGCSLFGSVNFPVHLQLLGNRSRLIAVCPRLGSRCPGSPLTRRALPAGFRHVGYY